MFKKTNMSNVLSYYMDFKSKRIAILTLLTSNDYVAELKARYADAKVTIIHKDDLKNKRILDAIHRLRENSYDLFVVYCEDLNFQSRLFILKGISLLAKTKKRLIVDSKGKSIELSYFRFIFVDFPKLVIEFIFGILVITISPLFLSFLSIVNFCFIRKGKGRVSAKRNKLKIAFLHTDFLYGYEKMGGHIAHMIGFSKAMVDLGNKLFFISPSFIPEISENVTPIYKIVPSQFFSNFSIVRRMAYNYKYIVEAKKILKKEKPDFFYHRYSPLNFAGVALSKLLKTHLIVEVNSPVGTIQNRGNQRWLSYSLMRASEQMILSQADDIIVVSETIKKYLNANGIKRDKVIVNPNGVDPNVFNPSINGDEIRRKYGLKDRIVIGFSGNFVRWHGIPNLIKAIANVVLHNPNVHLLLIGDSELRHTYEQIARRRNLDKYITFTGVIPYTKVPKYLAACDILVSPQIPIINGVDYHQSPVKIFEYMAMGKPVIASNLGQIGRILKHEETALLVEPRNIDQLTKGILRLIDDKKLAEKLAKRTREEVIKNFTWQKNAERIISLYTKRKV